MILVQFAGSSFAKKQQQAASQVFQEKFGLCLQKSRPNLPTTTTTTKKREGELNFTHSQKFKIQIFALFLGNV